MLLLHPAPLSVVLPVGQYDHRLTTTLAGYCAQTDPDFTLHLVQDGGPPGLPPPLRPYARRLRLRYHHLPGTGYRPASARNLGLEQCGQDRVLLADADCVPHPQLVAGHRRYGGQQLVIGMRRLLQQRAVEPLLHGPIPYATLLGLPGRPDPRLCAPRIAPLLRHLRAGTQPDPELRDRCLRHYQLQPPVPEPGWQAVLCWSCNLGLPPTGLRFDPGFDHAYGGEDLEFALRLILQQHCPVLADPGLLCYHLGHASRAPDHPKQQQLLLRTIQRLRAAAGPHGPRQPG